ncbi:MAG: TonB-dependent receptor [Gammaproteobacteria bacterium]
MNPQIASATSTNAVVHRRTGYPGHARMPQGLALAVALAALALPAQPARAQAAAAERASGLEEVVVTARRREEALQSVPIAITAISGADIDKASITDVQNLQYHAPTLTVSPNESKRNLPTFGIRGQRQGSSVITQDQSVNVYFAEVVQARPHGLNQALYDLQSVQVLKGPQGTLFGRNTTGGAVLVTPNRPVDRIEGYAALTGSTFDAGGGISGEGMFNLPLSDRAALRVAGKIARRDGFVENFDARGPSDLNDEHADSIRASLLARVTDDIETNFVFDWFQVDENGTATRLTYVRPGSALAVPLTAALARERSRGFQTTEINLPAFSKFEVWGISNTTTWDIGGVTLKNIVGYRSILEDDRVDQDGSPIQVVESVSKVADFTQVSDEFQVLGKAWEDRVEWVTGVYYFREYGSDLGTSNIFPVNPSNPSLTGGTADNISYSVFAQATTQVPAIEGLSFTGGLRYTWDKRQYNSVSRNGLGCRILTANGTRFPLAGCSKSVEESFDSPTWTFSLDYKIDEDSLLYLAHRRGYRSGGFNLRAERVEEFAPFEPEFVTDVELGLKTDWQIGDTKLRTNLAGYYQSYEDIQRQITVLTGTGALANTVVNAASARVYGGEFEATIIPAEGLVISGFYALVNAQYIEFMSATADFSNNEFAFVPQHSGAVTVRYTLPLDPGIGEIAVQGNYFTQSRIFFNDLAQGVNAGPIDTLGQKGYGIFNMQIDWSRILGSRFDASFFVKNLTDEEYTTSGLVFGDIALGYNAATLGDPRVIGLTLRYRYE